MFAIPVTDRTTETMFSIIDTYIEKGSDFYSYFWKLYPGAIQALNQHYQGNYNHDSVNHTVEYVSETGCHTNTIEGTWSGLKIGIPARRMNGDQIHVRRNHMGELWNALLETLQKQF